MKQKIASTVFFVIGLAILGYLVYDLGVDRIWLNVKKTGWWFIPVIGIWFFIYLLNSLVWYFILDDNGKSISFKRIYSITVSGFAINYITPFVNLGGEPYRIIALKNYVGINRSVSSVILYTMMHMLSHFIFWVTAIILINFTTPLDEYVMAFLFATAIVLLLFIYFFFTRYKKGVFISLINLFARLPLLKKLAAKFEGKRNTLEEIDEQIRQFYYNRPKKFFYSIVLEYFGRVVASLEFYFILMAIDVTANFLEVFYIYAGVTLITNILFFMPMQLGSREGGLYLVFTSLSFTAALGVYVSLITRIRELFWIFVGLILIRINMRGKPMTKKALFEYREDEEINESNSV